VRSIATDNKQRKMWVERGGGYGGSDARRTITHSSEPALDGPDKGPALPPSRAGGARSLNRWANPDIAD
jgi:hypothetical protein